MSKELSIIVPAREKQTIVRSAISKVNKYYKNFTFFLIIFHHEWIVINHIYNHLWSFVQQYSCNLTSTEQFTTLALFWSVSLCNFFPNIIISSYILFMKFLSWIIFVLLQYGLAEDTSRTGVPVVGNEIPFNELYSQSAIYIAAAHALKPNYSVSILYTFFYCFMQKFQNCLNDLFVLLYAFRFTPVPWSLSGLW